MNISLYYNEKNDCLYTDSIRSDYALFTSHTKKGFYSSKPQFIGGSSNFGINIQTNFGYGNASYFRVMLQYNNTQLINSYNWCDSINSNLSHFEVEPDPQNWENLFTQISSVYKGKDSWNYNGVIEIIEQLNNKLLHPDKVLIRNHSWSTKHNLWEGTTAILHLSKKVNELIVVTEFLKMIEHKHIKEGIDSICKKTIPIIEFAYRSFLQEREKTMQSTSILQGIKRLDEYYDTIYNYLKRTDQIKLLFEK